MDFGSQESSHDHLLSTKGENKSFIALVVYVDGVLIIVPNQDKINEVKDYLNKAFIIKDLGNASYFLGIEQLKIEEGL